MASMMFSAAAPAGYTSTPRTPSSIASARIFNLVLAVIAWFGLFLRFYLSFTAETGGGIHQVFISLNYFTILSNIIVACVMTALVFDPRRDGPKFRWLRLTALVQITITGVIYILVLAPLYTPETEPKGLDAVSNYCVHYIVPAMTVVGFIIFGPRRRITAVGVMTVLIIPTIWIVYTLIHGVVEPYAFTDGNSYPYGFLDVNKYGYLQVTINTVMIAIFGLVLGYLFMGIERLLSKAPDAQQIDSPSESAPVTSE